MLGTSSPISTRSASATVAVVILFYAFYFGSFINPDVYRIENRTTYHEYFGNQNLVGSDIDTIIIIGGLIVWTVLSTNHRLRLALLALFLIIISSTIILGSPGPIKLLSLISIPLIIGLIIFDKFSRPILKNQFLRLTVSYVSILILILACFSILVQLFPDRVKDFDPFYTIFVLLSSLSPILVMLIAFNLPIRIILASITTRIHSYPVGELKIDSISLKRRKTIIFLSVLCASSIILSLSHGYPNQRTIGVDTEWYLSSLEYLRNSSDLDEFSSRLFTEKEFADRSLTLFLLYPLVIIPNDDLANSLDYIMPAFLAPLLIILTFFLTTEITRNRHVALISAFIAVFGFQNLIAIYAGFYANWIALIMGYAMIVFLLRSLRQNKVASYAAFYLILITLIFVHSYTWSFFLVMVSLILVALFYIKLYDRKRILIVMLLVLSTIPIDIMKAFITSSPAALQSDLVLFESTGVGMSQFQHRWTNLVGAIQIHLGSVYSNFLILTLSLIGILVITSRSLTGAFLISSFSIAVFPLLFSERELITRVLFDLPFQIPAAVALYWLRQRFTIGNVLYFIVMVSVISIGVIYYLNI